MITFDTIVVQVQKSFTQTKTLFIYLFNSSTFICISHLAQNSMITKALKWHHKNISNKITAFIEFWQAPDVLFGSFDCDCILRWLKYVDIRKLNDSRVKNNNFPSYNPPQIDYF